MRPDRAVLAAFILLATAGPALAQESRPANRSTIESAFAELRRDLATIEVPSVDSVTRGARTVAAGEEVRGPIATWGGNLEIRGSVAGDVVAIDGDVIVAEGARVDGDVLSVRGSTRIQGIVTGSVMRLDASLAAPVPTGAPATAVTVWHSLGVTLATLAIFLMLGIGVLIFAGPTLDGVAEVIERDLARSFLIGIVGQLALVPGLLLLVVALALTVLGALLIPFGIVAYVLAVSGAVSLAFLAIALVVGRSISRRRRSAPLTRRAEALRAMLIGIATLFAVWIAGSLLGWNPFAAAIVRIAALAITWVAVTTGFGAVLISRAGTRRADPVAARSPIPDEMAWQTPTPVSGVAAARRPTPVASGRPR